jgi:hypothetical protein
MMPKMREEKLTGTGDMRALSLRGLRAYEPMSDTHESSTNKHPYLQFQDPRMRR